MSNTTVGSRGRLGNQIIRNTVCNLIAKKYDLQFNYGYYDECSLLGIELYTDGNNFHNETIDFDETHFLKCILNNEDLKKNIYTSTRYYQTSPISHILRNYFNENEIKQNIQNKNPYKERYNNNNDVFIHVRLGDVIQYSPNFEYFNNVLSNLSFDKGYIASDTINHEICQKLIKKFKLIPFENDDPVKIIQFGSTTRHIVCSTGTFGWCIGVFGWFSTIYYPKILTDTFFPQEIYGFNDWICNETKLTDDDFEETKLTDDEFVETKLTDDEFVETKLTDDEFVEMFGCDKKTYDKLLCENEYKILKERDRMFLNDDDEFVEMFGCDKKTYDKLLCLRRRSN